MTIKPDYAKYSNRLSFGILSAILISALGTILLLLNDIGRVGNFVVAGIFGITSIILIISIIKKSKDSLVAITIDSEKCVLEINQYDRPKEIITLNIAETRIKMWEIFFPFVKFGRNYKLIIETKQGLTYKRIFQQYEIGNWNLDNFKEVIKLYGESKGVPASTASYTRDNISTDKS